MGRIMGGEMEVNLTITTENHEFINPKSIINSM